MNLMPILFGLLALAATVLLAFAFGFKAGADDLEEVLRRNDELEKELADLLQPERDTATNSTTAHMRADEMNRPETVVYQDVSSSIHQGDGCELYRPAETNNTAKIHPQA